jgi:beta-phosphoglucomutase-like phosphatase (HAD superfamily)
MTEQMGRIAFRVEGDWWVAYYALPATMEGALELARIQMAIVANHPQRKNTFMKLIQGYVKEIVPAFEVADSKPAPEHERAGRG